MSGNYVELDSDDRKLINGNISEYNEALASSLDLVKIREILRDLVLFIQFIEHNYHNQEKFTSIYHAVIGEIVRMTTFGELKNIDSKKSSQSEDGMSVDITDHRQYWNTGDEGETTYEEIFIIYLQLIKLRQLFESEKLNFA